MELRFSNLPLRTKVTLIAVVTAILITASFYIAGNILVNDSEKRFREATLHGKQILWEQVIVQQIKELELNIPQLQHNRHIINAVKDNDKEAISKHATELFNQLGSSNIITSLIILDLKMNPVYMSPGEQHFNNSNKILIQIKNALENDDTNTILDRHDDSKLAMFTVFPLYAGDRLVGAGIFEKDLKGILQYYKYTDQSEVFVMTNEGDIEYATNGDLTPIITSEFASSGNTLEKEVRYIPFNEKTYSLSRQPIEHDDEGNVTAHLITLNDITLAHNSRQRIIFLSSIAIIISIIIMFLVLFFYLRYSLAPLKQLMDTVKRFGKGEMDVRVELNSNDEIGELATAFNSMVQKIQDSIEHERQLAEDIEGKASLIHEVVEMASHGDLTGEMMVFRDKGVISDLSESVTGMITNLNTLVTQVQQSGIQVTSSATQIAATAKQQEATITEQAATTNEIMATTKQISATSKELLGTMDNITKVSEETASSAETGRDALSHMEGTMNHMVEASSSITSKLAVLNEKAGNINTVVTTITKVADQTNLLSLNAAIEAEKAGEYGVGFSVVATEIRRLADQTAVATWDIEQMVQEMQSAVSAGVMGMDKFSEEIRQGVGDVRQVGSQLAEIIEKVQKILPQFEKVHEGMHSQTLGADQISESMIQLNEATQQTAESLRQSNDAISQLNEAAQGLQGGISKFKINTGQ